MATTAVMKRGILVMPGTFGLLRTANVKGCRYKSTEIRGGEPRVDPAVILYPKIHREVVVEKKEDLRVQLPPKIPKEVTKGAKGENEERVHVGEQRMKHLSERVEEARDKASTRLLTKRYSAALQREENLSESEKKLAEDTQNEIIRQEMKERKKEKEELQRTALRQQETRRKLEKIMLKFRAPIRYAVAYGSGVYQQQGYTENHQKKTMVDMVFAVTHPEHWHAINMQQHREHYSMMSRMLGSASVSFIQEKLGAGVYYNTYVEMEGVQLKYGVISVDSMTNDLLGWTSMYLAGRLHKPTLVLQDDPFIRLCEQVNLANAVRVALLMLPKNFTERELFTTIASLSYMGDFRMIYGENPNKVRNIVDAQLPSFRELYSGTIEGFSNLKYIGMNFLQQDMDPIVRARMLSKLPQQICTNTVKLYSRSSAYPSSLSSSSTTSSESLSNIDPALLSVVQHPELLPLFLTSSIRSIVARPALTQSLKGIYSAGFSKSASYLWDKLNKSKL